jgi:acylphosphatase
VSEKIARHLRIEGRVQGVGFRYALQNRAKELKLTGWVRNRHDASVEAVVCGNMAAIDEVIAWAHHGPSLASVSRVLVSDTEIPPDEIFTILSKE